MTDFSGSHRLREDIARFDGQLGGGISCIDFRVGHLQRFIEGYFSHSGNLHSLFERGAEIGAAFKPDEFEGTSAVTKLYAKGSISSATVKHRENFSTDKNSRIKVLWQLCKRCGIAFVEVLAGEVVEEVLYAKEPRFSKGGNAFFSKFWKHGKGCKEIDVLGGHGNAFCCYRKVSDGMNAVNMNGEANNQT